MIANQEERTSHRLGDGTTVVDHIPLCVDLDGTLLRIDTLHEGVLALLKKQPLALFQLPLWLMRGRAHLKREVTRRVQLDVDYLPANEEFRAYLQTQHAEGRKIILVTAADGHLGDAMAQRFGFFDGVMSSDGVRNLSGTQKANALNERFGRENFDYAGNAPADLAVWALARRAIVVNCDSRTLEKARRTATVERVFTTPGNRLELLFRAMRPHQWVKNALLFIPLLGAHAWTSLPKVQAVALSFIAFSLCASSVYLLNDLLDLSADRRHPNKVQRPFASGGLPVSWGLAMCPALLAAAVCVSIFLPSAFIATLAIYYLITVAYSLRLKRFALIDVFVLVSLYGLRVLAGGFAAQVAVSDWLLIFCLFLFLSLALAKRFTEIRTLEKGGETGLAGRGYGIDDAEAIAKMGIASGYIAVVILALYITNPEVVSLYSRPINLLLACPFLLYWISRVWLLAQRDQLHDDPIVFAVTDKQSWLIVAGVILAVLVAGPK